MGTFVTSDLISVIVPVYNAEKTLNRCVDSILAQHGVTLELILVDDGSQDESIKICREYERAYPNVVRFLEQENAGPSAARNHALDIANGEYISFVDSDDYIDPEMLEGLLSGLLDFNASVACCGITKVDKSQHESRCPIASVPTIVSREKYCEDMLLSKIEGYLWNRLYRCEVLGNARLDEAIDFAEDLLFNCMILNNISCAVYVPGCPYHYVEYEGSLSHQSDLYVVDGKWAFDEVSRRLRLALSDAGEFDDVLSFRETQLALDGIRLLSGHSEYADVREELKAQCRKGRRVYFSRNKSLLHRALYYITLFAPEFLIQFGMELISR